MLCNNRELMQHLSSYIEVLKVKSPPEPSIYLPIKIANHILKIQPYTTTHNHTRISPTLCSILNVQDTKVLTQKII